MFYLLTATTPVPLFGCERLVINFNGPKEQAVQYVRSLNVGTPGVKYTTHGPLSANDPTNLVLAIQRATPANTSPQGVIAGQQAPHGQPGLARPDEPIGVGGFQKLGDMSLPPSGDGEMFGDTPDDSLFSDIVLDGGKTIEIPRT